MTWRILVSCRDCTGEDPMGCGDGKPWWHEEGGCVSSYPTEAAAAEEALRLTYAGGPPWDYRAEEEP